MKTWFVSLVLVAGCQFATGLHGLEIDSSLEPAPAAQSVTASAGSPGSACQADTECQAGVCFEGFCYGAVGPDGACTTKYECRLGFCAAEVPQGNSGACLEGTLECLDKNIDPCFVNLAIATCQLVNKCNPQPGSFDRCVAQACVEGSKEYTLTACQAAEAGFGQDLPCPD